MLENIPNDQMCGKCSCLLINTFNDFLNSLDFEKNLKCYLLPKHNVEKLKKSLESFKREKKIFDLDFGTSISNSKITASDDILHQENLVVDEKEIINEKIYKISVDELKKLSKIETPVKRIAPRSRIEVDNPNESLSERKFVRHYSTPRLGYSGNISKSLLGSTNVPKVISHEMRIDPPQTVKKEGNSGKQNGKKASLNNLDNIIEEGKYLHSKDKDFSKELVKESIDRVRKNISIIKSSTGNGSKRLIEKKSELKIGNSKDDKMRSLNEAKEPHYSEKEIIAEDKQLDKVDIVPDPKLEEDLTKEGSNDELNSIVETDKLETPKSQAIQIEVPLQPKSSELSQKIFNTMKVNLLDMNILLRINSAHILRELAIDHEVDKTYKEVKNAFDKHEK